ncbi:MAG: Uncharacterised protein [Prochlorococcus marinus str. MIT 9215]|nr:MAG: Uncharacterised protein [Prochlorococcus marinus str. MIT 9215]
MPTITASDRTKSFAKSLGSSEANTLHPLPSAIGISLASEKDKSLNWGMRWSSSIANLMGVNVRHALPPDHAKPSFAVLHKPSGPGLVGKAAGAEAF